MRMVKMAESAEFEMNPSAATTPKAPSTTHVARHTDRGSRAIVRRGEPLWGRPSEPLADMVVALPLVTLTG